MQYSLCVSSLTRNPQYPQGVPVSDQSSVDEHFGGSNLAHRVPLLSMDRRKSIQPQTGYEPNLSRRHRNCGSTRTPRVEPGAREESGDALVFPKQLLHLLNFIPSTYITYSKKYTFILNASKTPTAYTIVWTCHTIYIAPLWTCPSPTCYTEAEKYSGWHRRPRRGSRILPKPCVGTLLVHRVNTGARWTCVCYKAWALGESSQGKSVLRAWEEEKQRLLQQRAGLIAPLKMRGIT